MKTLLAIFLRLVTLPFIAVVAIIHHVVAVIDTLWLWLRFGGEVIPYTKDRKMIAGVYDKVCEMVDEQEVKPPHSIEGWEKYRKNTRFDDIVAICRKHKIKFHEEVRQGQDGWEYWFIVNSGAGMEACDIFRQGDSLKRFLIEHYKTVYEDLNKYFRV